MNPGRAQHEHPIVHEGRLVGPWTCVGCRYALENLRISDPCPECGRSLAPSLEPKLLRFAPLEVLTRMRVGARTIELAGVLAVLYVPAIFLLISAFDALARRIGLPDDVLYVLQSPLFPMVFLYAIPLLFARGVFAITSRAVTERASCAGARHVARALRCSVVVLLALITSLLTFLVFDWLSESRWTPDIDPLLPATMTATLFAIIASSVFGLSLYAWTLGDRTFARGRPLRVIAIIPTLFLLLTILFGTFALMLVEPMERMLQDPPTGWLQWAFIIASILAMIFGALTAGLSFLVVDALRMAVKHDEREARAAIAPAGKVSS